MRYLVLDKKQRITLSGDLPKRVTRLLEEVEKAGHSATFAYYDSISISFTDGVRTITVDGEDITDYTHILMGGHYPSTNQYELKMIIISHIEEWNKQNPGSIIQVQNSSAMGKFPHYTKLWFAHVCQLYDLPHLNTYFTANRDYHMDNGSIEYPLIAKISSGENALKVIDGKEKVKKNVFLLSEPGSWNKELLEQIADSDYLIQEFTDVGEDYRIFVANGRVIGGWKRVSPPDNFMTVTKGSEYFYYNEPEPKVKELAEKAARALEADFIAVDIIFKDSEPFILEFSLHPGFNAYETKCQDGEPTNIAEAIINAFPGK